VNSQQKTKLKELSLAKEPSLRKECRAHHFGEWGRCRYCSMKTTYYYECMATLNSWPKKEKNTEEWRRLVDNLRCKPHFHEGVGV
jgi:hypothetical protein